jgi:RNA 2',3'-cyclic 3'-phosphodiesterase
MDEQLLLFDMPPPRTARPDVFAVVRPDALTAQHLYRFTDLHCRRHGVKARKRPPEILHITLRAFGSFEDLKAQDLKKIRRICKTAALLSTPFDVSFDRVLPFSNGPLALVSEEANVDLHRLHWLAMGAPERKPKFSPHISLAYPSDGFEEERIPPVDWRVDELVLVRSLTGRTEHVELGRWQLGGSL